MSSILARVSKAAVAAMLVVAGASVLSACSSDKANYRPAPNYTKPTSQSAPVYTPPSASPQYAPPPAAAPAPAAGGYACGKGKCG